MAGMEISGIKETCLYISDINATRNFYHGVLGLHIFAEKDSNHIFFRAGNDMLLCFLHGSTTNQTSLPPHHAKGEIHFAFEVPSGDYDSWKKKIASSGIPIEHEAQWTEHSSSFYFRDPDNHCVEILSPGLWD